MILPMNSQKQIYKFTRLRLFIQDAFFQFADLILLGYQSRLVSMSLHSIVYAIPV